MKPYRLARIAEHRFNNQLRDLYGVDTASGQAMWRIVWSDDEYELRETDCTPAGIILPYTYVAKLPKYAQYIQQRYILEHLVGLNIAASRELAGAKSSYEIIWTFEDKVGNYLPPNIEACKYIIALVTDAMALARDGRSTSKSFRKYLDEDYSEEASIENKNKRITEIQEYLFGDQSSLAGTTKTGESVIVPRNFGDENA